MTFEEFKRYEVINYTKKENKYKINEIRNQYYLGMGLEYIVYKILYDTKYTDDRIFKETQEHLQSYLEKHNIFYYI